MKYISSVFIVIHINKYVFNNDIVIIILPVAIWMWNILANVKGNEISNEIAQPKIGHDM